MGGRVGDGILPCIFFIEKCPKRSELQIQIVKQKKWRMMNTVLCSLNMIHIMVIRLKFSNDQDLYLYFRQKNGVGDQTRVE